MTSTGACWTVHGANSTLNKGATGLPLRASAGVGREEGEGERKERERDFMKETAFRASREVLTMHREEREEQHFC